MHARSFFIGLAWLALTLCRAQEAPPVAPPPAPSQDHLDGGLLQPQWFGPGPVWTRDWQADFFWAKPGVRLDPPAIYLHPWEEPKFLTRKDPLDYASGWEGAEFLQTMLRTRLSGLPGLRVVASPSETPYHAMGRIVEATHIRQGAVATFGPLAGLPTFTWDFKVVDVRTGDVLLGSHHRSVWAPASAWISVLEQPMRQMVGLPPTPEWKQPPGAQEEEDGSWTWVAPDLLLSPGCLEAGPWSAETDRSAKFNLGFATGNALRAEQCLRVRLARSRLGRRGEGVPAFLLTGRTFSSMKYLLLRYRAQVTEVATGRVVVQLELRQPFGFSPASISEQVAERIVARLEVLQEGVVKPPASGPEASMARAQTVPEPGPTGQGSLLTLNSVGNQGEAGRLPATPTPDKSMENPQPGRPVPDLGATVSESVSADVEKRVPSDPSRSPLTDRVVTAAAAQAPARPWEGLDRLAPAAGGVDKAWVSPLLELSGRTLLVGEWSEPTLKPEADSYDRQVASSISARAPAWLYGALAAHPDRGFKINRQEGDLRLEGRVVHLYQPDRSKISTMMGQAFTLGLSTKAEGILQLRVVDMATGTTLALVEENLGSFQMASTGIPYKAFKWLAQDLVPWLLREGLRPDQPKSAPAEVPQVDPKGTPAQPSS